jgi:hypothetical protein
MLGASNENGSGLLCFPGHCLKFYQSRSSFSNARNGPLPKVPIRTDLCDRIAASKDSPDAQGNIRLPFMQPDLVVSSRCGTG